ncbi:5'/3'-nucleotidase SurE [Neisseriaceae bacterium JH1-16]|nr:5'/3'-nucleotidase SurE [Neisseriaceae bacterium JH1-16]
MKPAKPLIWLPLLAALSAPTAHALNILMCNDDGFTAANLRATALQLKAAGHNVIVSSPADNQSGKGGAMNFLAPIPAVTANERGVTDKALSAGAAGVGTAPDDASVYYVNGTPTMACLYGLDVAAPQVFGKAPDLVISGPNEGANTGMVNMSSGTVSNAYYAINRGLPAIAFNDAIPTITAFASVAGNQSAHAYEIGTIVVKLVAMLQANQSKAGGRLLPPATGLNVNIPLFTAGSGSSLPFILTQMGTATDYAPAFYADLSQNPLAAGYYGQSLAAIQGKPGIGLVSNGVASNANTLPSGTVVPKDNNPKSEGNVLSQKLGIAVTPMQGVPQASRYQVEAVRLKLQSLLK